MLCLRLVLARHVRAAPGCVALCGAPRFQITTLSATVFSATTSLQFLDLTFNNLGCVWHWPTPPSVPPCQPRAPRAHLTDDLPLLVCVGSSNRSPSNPARLSPPPCVLVLAATSLQPTPTPAHTHTFRRPTNLQHHSTKRFLKSEQPEGPLPRGQLPGGRRFVGRVLCWPGCHHGMAGRAPWLDVCSFRCRLLQL
jgi:hypothetical protein